MENPRNAFLFCVDQTEPSGPARHTGSGSHQVQRMQQSSRPQLTGMPSLLTYVCVYACMFVCMYVCMSLY